MVSQAQVPTKSRIHTSGGDQARERHKMAVMEEEVEEGVPH